jgi:hypothetical protein
MRRAYRWCCVFPRGGTKTVRYFRKSSATQSEARHSRGRKRKGRLLRHLSNSAHGRNFLRESVCPANSALAGVLTHNGPALVTNLKAGRVGDDLVCFCSAGSPVKVNLFVSHNIETDRP